MPDKKFELNKKKGLYMVAGAALAGSLVAAVITSPDMLHSVFNPDKYSFNDNRENGDVAYSSAEEIGKTSDGKDSDFPSLSNDKNKKDKALTQTEADGTQNTTPEPDKTKRDKDNENDSSSKEESEASGTDKNGVSYVNTGLSVSDASSVNSDGEDLGEDSENVVEVGKGEDWIDSVGSDYTPAPQKESETPAPTLAPTPKPTLRPHFSGGSGNKNHQSPTSAPEYTHSPQITQEPIVTEAPVITEKPVVTEAPVVTKEPMPTEAPEPTKPSDIIKDNEAAGNEIYISKGEIGITNNTGGGGSITSGGATKIDFTSFTGDQSGVEYIQISSSIKNIDFETVKVLFPNLKGYVVNRNNKYFKSIDGVLYSKDGKILYACPAKVSGITEFPEELEAIYDGAFLGSSMDKLTLPGTVKTVGKNAFAQADMGEVTFLSEDISLGATVFYNSADDGLSVKKLIFTSNTPPTVADNTALKFKNPHSGLDTSGMIIEVPDSENDAVLCAYMKAWGETIDGIYGSGMTSYLFNTAKNAGNSYSYENKALYKILGEDGYKLIYAAPSTEGEFTPSANTKVIETGAFDGCGKITAINLLDTVTELKSGCFKGLDSLTSIMIASITPIEADAEVLKDIDFEEVKIYVNPDLVETYRNTWGKTLDTLFGEGSGERIINAASTSHEYIDGALYAISEEGKVLVDAPHTNLDNFAVADGTTKIENGAFGSKYTYNYVLIPDTVTEISENAFTSASINVLVMTSMNPLDLNANADAIKEIYVPESALDDYKLKFGDSIKISSPSLNYVADSHAIYGVDVDGNYTLYDLSTMYKGTFTMLDRVKEIRERALYGCEGVEEINFSVITEKIGTESFANNTSLKSVDMVKMTALTQIPEMAFYNCTSMTDMKLPLLITKIGNSAAENCTSLVTVNFNKLTKLEEIGDKAFYNNTSLTAVSLSSARRLTAVGESVFENCTSITTVRMPLNLKKMGDKMFKNASSLNRIAFANELEEIGAEALYGTALEKMNISSLTELEKIGEGAFAQCEDLKEIILPEKVKVVSERMAENDVSLTKVVLSEKTTEIGTAAFRGCNLLEEIIIPAAVEKIGEEAFAKSGLKKITVKGNTPAELGDNAFGDEFDEMKIYVPQNTYGIYVAAWNMALYNRAGEIIEEITEEPEETPEPQVTQTPEPTSAPQLPDIPEIPEATQEPTNSPEPETTQEPEVTQSLQPETTQEPKPEIEASEMPVAVKESDEVTQSSQAPETE